LHHSLKRFDLAREEWELRLADITYPHRPAQDDQHADFIKVGRDFIAPIQTTHFHGDAEVAQDWDQSAGSLVVDVLQNDGLAHGEGEMILDVASGCQV
jgi:hypothetical protein